MTDVENPNKNEAETVATQEPQEAKIIFSTPAKYDSATVALISFAPLCLLVTLFILSGLPSESYDNGSQGKWFNLLVLIASLLGMLLLFGLVLPQHYEIHQSEEEATLVIGTHFRWIQYSFPDITAALENPSYLQSPCDGSRPRLKFATTLEAEHRILVRRLVQGSWDILVTPEDAQGFVKAVFGAAAHVEEREASRQRIDAFGGSQAQKAAMQMS